MSNSESRTAAVLSSAEAGFRTTRRFLALASGALILLYCSGAIHEPRHSDVVTGNGLEVYGDDDKTLMILGAVPQVKRRGLFVYGHSDHVVAQVMETNGCGSARVCGDRVHHASLWGVGDKTELAFWSVDSRGSKVISEMGVNDKGVAHLVLRRHKSLEVSALGSVDPVGNGVLEVRSDGKPMVSAVVSVTSGKGGIVITDPKGEVLAGLKPVEK